MNKQPHSQKEIPEEIPPTKTPHQPNPEKDPNMVTDTHPNKSNPINPKENK